MLLNGAVALPLAACETSTLSSDCPMVLGSVECTLEISGSTRHDLPYPVGAADGSEKPASQQEDSIKLVEVTDGTATVDINYDEFQCATGEEFTVASTTFTCSEIGDDSISLELVRAEDGAFPGRSPSPGDKDETPPTSRQHPLVFDQGEKTSARLSPPRIFTRQKARTPDESRRPVGDADVKYESKTVQTLRGTEARAVKKWEREGWEVVDSVPGKLKTTLTIRRPKPKKSWLLIGGAGALVAFLIAFALIMSVIQGEDPEDAATSSSVTTGSTSAEEESGDATESSSDEDGQAQAAEQPVDEVVTVDNDERFAALVAGTDYCAESVASFARDYEGRTLQFDGSIGAMGPHDSYKTRYDILIGAGDFSETESAGPAFQFRDVNMSDFHLTGEDIPDTIGVGDNLRITATVDRYIDQQCLLLLDPVQTEIR